MIYASIDCETSGLQIGAESTKIVELAVVLYDSDSKSPFEFWSSWVYDQRYPPLVNEEAFKVNGLNPDHLKKFGMTPAEAFRKLNHYLSRSHAALGQNCLNFDKPLLEHEFKTYGLQLTVKPWVDIRTDLPYPTNVTSRRLGHVAVDHGVQIIGAHKALFDAFTVVEIAKQYCLDTALERAKSPMIRIEGKPTMDKNHEAKAQRYRWNPERKVWFKEIRQCDFQREVDAVSFKVSIGV